MAKETVAKVVQKPEEPVEVDVLANAIVKLGETAEKLMKSGLRQETVVLLLHDHSGVNKTQVRAVLSSMTKLRTYYTTK